MARNNLPRLNLVKSLYLGATALLALSTPVLAQDPGRQDGRGAEMRQFRGERMRPMGEPQPRVNPQAGGQQNGAWQGQRRGDRPVIEANQGEQRRIYQSGDGRARDWSGDRGRWQRGDERARYRDGSNDPRVYNDGRVDADRSRVEDNRRDWQGRNGWNDGRDGRNVWQSDRRGYGNRESWRGGGNESWRDNRGWGSGDRGRDRGWDRGWRNNNRYDWSSYRARNRNIFSSGRYYSPYRNYSYRRLSIGFSLGSQFYSSRYWINDPYYYRLPEVYGPYRWVRYYDDVLLVDTYTGEVVDAIYDFYY